MRLFVSYPGHSYGVVGFYPFADVQSVEYEKVFIQTIYISSSLTPLLVERKTLLGLMSESRFQLQRSESNRPNRISQTSHPTSKLPPLMQNYLFLYNIFLIIASANQIRI